MCTGGSKKTFLAEGRQRQATGNQSHTTRVKKSKRSGCKLM